MIILYNGRNVSKYVHSNKLFIGLQLRYKKPIELRRKMEIKTSNFGDFELKILSICLVNWFQIRMFTSADHKVSKWYIFAWCYVFLYIFLENISVVYLYPLYSNLPRYWRYNHTCIKSELNSAYRFQLRNLKSDLTK